MGYPLQSTTVSEYAKGISRRIRSDTVSSCRFFQKNLGPVLIQELIDFLARGADDVYVIQSKFVTSWRWCQPDEYLLILIVLGETIFDVRLKLPLNLFG
jgi:hypothetical protein